MKSILRLMAAAFLLASCGGREQSAPRNLDDACALAAERPAYFRAMRDTERRWNVPLPVQMAIIHAESAFRTEALSPAGAQGLMQLMPATARWVAKRIGLKDYSSASITDMDTNVTLGTHYLSIVYSDMGNDPVLASAAYNAGPGRARKWRADGPLEGAIYAETIPFNETRDYVKKVMSNAVYYNTLFEGKPQSLKSTLGVVRARGQGEAGVEQLP